MQDWDDLRFLLAVHRGGSLAGASRTLRVDATTVGRRVDQAEAHLGAPVFVRQRGAWRPTALGAEVLRAAERAERAVQEAAQAAREAGSTPSGRVRLTTVEAVATWLVPQVLPDLQARWPHVELELSTTTRVLDLARGEADLAIRVGRPREPDLVARRLGGFTERPYASRTWLSERGLEPGRLASLDGVPVCVMPGTGQRADLARLGASRVVLRSSSTRALIEAVAHGGGVGLLPSRLVAGDDRVVHLDGLGVERRRDLWLVFREEVGRTPAVRAVVDLLTERLA